LLKLLRKNKEAMRCNLEDIKGISLIVVQHMIHLEDGVRPYRDCQRRLDPTLQEVVRRKC